MKRPLAAALATATLLVPMASMAWADEMTSTLRPAENATQQPYYTPDPYGYNTPSTGYNTYNPAATTYTGYSTQSPLQGRVSTIPRGTALMVRLNQPISSQASRLGEAVSATLDNPLVVDGATIVPAGSAVNGQVVAIEPTRRLGRHGEVTLKFYEIRTPDGNIIPIQGHIATEDNTGRFRGDTNLMDVGKGVGTAAVGTGLGALGGTAIGGILGVAGTGAVLGTGVGAVAGLGYAVARKGKEVLVPSGSRITIKVDEDSNAVRP